MKKLLIFILCVCLLAGCFTACTGPWKDPGTSDPKQPDEGKTGQETPGEDYSETARLNVLWSAAGGTDGKFECVYQDYQSQIPDLLYDTLIKLDLEDNQKYVNRMADDWSVSEDELVYTFHIRDGLSWTDGEPVTADDFVFSLEAQLRGYGVQNERGSFAFIKGAAEFAGGTADSIAGVAADGQTLTITLDQPYSFFLRTLTTFCPYPRHGFPEDLDYAQFGTYPYWENPIHCGPYKLESVSFPDSCLLVRNDDWYGEKPGIQYVQGLSYSTGGADAASAAMIAGKLDLVHSNVYNDINFAQNVVDKNPEYAYAAFTAPYLRYFATNMVGSADEKWNTFMGEPEFRRALELAMDKEAIASYYPGQAVALSTMVNPAETYYNSDIPAFKQNLEEAKTLLEKVGYDGSTVRVAYYYDDQISMDIIDLVCQNLGEIGVKAEPILFAQDLANAIYETKNWDILYCGGNQLSGIENYNIVSTGAIYDKYLGNEADRDELFTQYIEQVLATTDQTEWKRLGDIMQENGIAYAAQIPVIAMNKIMVYNDAKWDFDENWVSGTDLAIYRNCDLRLEQWKLNKP